MNVALVYKQGTNMGATFYDLSDPRGVFSMVFKIMSYLAQGLDVSVYTPGRWREIESGLE